MAFGSKHIPARSDPERLLARGRRLLLAESGFARAMGATLTGTFMTAMVVALGGREYKVGLAMAASHIGSLGMLLANPVLNRVGSRRRFCLFTLGAVRCLRMAVAALPVMIYAGISRDVLFGWYAACALLSAFFGFSAEISRRSWIADLVPPDQRGRFFGRRMAIVLLVQAVVLLGGGQILDASRTATGQELVGLTVLIGMGAALGWCGWVLLYRAPEPAFARPRRRTGLVRSLALPFRRPRFRPLLLVAGWHYFAMGLCGTFFDYYMRDHLEMSWTWIARVNVIGFLVAMAGAPLYGAWADRAGARRVLSVTVLVKGIFPALWILVAPQWWWAAFLVVLLRTFNSAGMICWMRLSLGLSPPRNQAAFLAMHQVVTGLGIAAGAFVGGGLAEWLRLEHFRPVVLGFSVVPLHVVFILSTVLRLSALPMLRLLREPRRHLARPD